MRRPVVGVLVVGLVGAPAPAHALPGPGPRPTALLIHGGGFIDRNGLSTPTGPLRRLGYRVRVARYPLGNVRGAYRAVARQAARLGRRGPVLAIGESAGGSIATWLAGHRRVDAAVSVGAPQDFRAWGNPVWGAQVRLPTTALRRRYSPIRTYSRRSGDPPLLAVHYRGDIVVPLEHTTRLRKRGAHLLILDGFGHTQPRWLHAGGLQFLRRQARRVSWRSRVGGP